VTTTRLESFSDGVLAVAITLLALSITVPDPVPGQSLAGALSKHWPEYVAYATSFMTIGIIWINHHAMVRRLNAVDHVILTLNLVLLLFIGLLPFTTALMAKYLNAGHGQNLAAAIYSGSYLLMSIAFSAMNRNILFRKAHLLGVDLDERERRRILTRGVTGLGPYVLAVALAPLSAYATLAICGAVAVFYALPIASGGDISTT